MQPYSGEVVVAFGVDAAYSPHLATAIASVVANAPGGRFWFMVIHDGIPEPERELVSAAARGQVVQWCDITGSPILELDGNTHINYISRATYYRFSIPDFVPPGVHRVVYLDADLVVLADLRDIWNLDLEGAPLGAVHDGGLTAEAFAETWSLQPVDLGYFNAGVLLLDIERIRSEGLFLRAVDLLRTRFQDFPMADQDVMNLLVWGRWRRMDSRWNVQRRMLVHLGSPPSFRTPERLRARHRPKIVHYTEAFKPWLQDAWHPLTGLYFRYLWRTPYWKRVIDTANVTPLKLLKHFVRTQITLTQLKP